MYETNELQTTLPALGRFKLYTKSLTWARMVLALPVQGCLRDQLRRAAHSVVLNAAEGGAQVSVGLKKKHYRICRASLWEVAAALDLLAIELGPARVDERLAGLLRELDAMLASLLKRA